MAVEKTIASTSLAEVVDRILDKASSLTRGLASRWSASS